MGVLGLIAGIVSDKFDQLAAFQNFLILPTTKSQTNVVVLSRVSISPLFQSRSFTYRTAENSDEQDPYAGFDTPRAPLGESIRASMRRRRLGRVVEPGSGLTPKLVVEVRSTNSAAIFATRRSRRGDGDRLICYEVKDGTRGVSCSTRLRPETPLARKTPDALRPPGSTCAKSWKRSMLNTPKLAPRNADNMPMNASPGPPRLMIV